jgi:hypothetical protein
MNIRNIETFKIHFFRERSIPFTFSKDDFKYFLSSFIEIEDLSDNDTITLRYYMEKSTLPYHFDIVAKKMSDVYNIFKVDPSCVDLRLRVEFFLLTPSFVVNHFLEIIKKIIVKYNFYYYLDYLSDVSRVFKPEILLSLHQNVKKDYFERNEANLSLDYLKVSTLKLSPIIKYLHEINSLRKFYKDTNINLPLYEFYKNNNSLIVKVVIEDLKGTVFPPSIDFLKYKFKDYNFEINYFDLENLLSSVYLEDVPGFIKGTKVTKTKVLKKIFKLIRKNLLLEENVLSSKINLEYLID